MSSERNGGVVVFTCDTDGNTLETEERDFTAALNQAKRDGWSAYQLGGLWCHRCAKCTVADLLTRGDV